jgi:hypothetical protein
MTRIIGDCNCGGTVCAATDGNGIAIERCDRCNTSRAIPRGPLHEHPILAAEQAAVDAEVEAGRAKNPLCAKACGRHVSHPKADLCFICSKERRRSNDREPRRAKTARRAS